MQSSQLDPVDGTHVCDYVAHPLGWTNYLDDNTFATTRCYAEADYQTRTDPVRYLCAKHAARVRVPFRRADDIKLQHMALS